MSRQERSRWKELLPLLAKSTGSAVIMLVAVAAATDLAVQAGIQGLYPALLTMLSNLLGDVVVSPLVDRLLSCGGDELEELANRFAEKLNQTDVRCEIAEILRKQDAIMGILGTALQHHEDQIVKRILQSLAKYRDFDAHYIVEQVCNQYKNRLDPESRYLTGLIYRLQGCEGPLEYIDLRGNVTTKEAGYSVLEEKMRKFVDPAFSLVDIGAKGKMSERISEQNKTPIENIREAAEKYPRFVLLGEPGAGKTTTLRRLALDAAWDRIADSESPLPLFRNLPDWRNDQELDDFLEKDWFLDLHLPIALVRGDVTLYLDGLNEIGTLGKFKAKKLKEWLKGLNRPKYAKIACRMEDYSDLDLGITSILIEALDEDRIRAFAVNYLGDKVSGFLTQVLPQSERERNDRHSLFQLARNPFMLRALILVYQSLPDRDLPSNKGMVFRNLIKFLWNREKERNTSGWVGHDTMVAAFSSLASNMMETGRSTIVPLNYVEEYVQPVLLKVAVKANIVNIEDELLSFYHQSIQTYFAAEYYTRNVEKISKLETHILDPSWRELYPQIASLLDNPEQFLDSLRAAVEKIERERLGAKEASAFLKWADRKRPYETELTYKLPTVRAMHIFVEALAFSFELASKLYYHLAPADSGVLNYLASQYPAEVVSARLADLETSRSISSSLLNICENALNVANSFDSVRTISRIRDYGFWNNRGWVFVNRLALALVFDLAFDLDAEVDYTLSFEKNVRLAIKLCRRMNQNELEEALARLRMPSKTHLYGDTWEAFGSKLRAIMLKHRRIGFEWELSTERWQAIDEYMEATVLLVNCLKAAAIKDQEEIENQILMPAG